MIWNLAEAKNKLSEVLNNADEKAQVIKRRGREYVLLNGETYRKLSGQTPDFLDYLIGHIPSSDDLELMPRKVTPMREIDL